MDGIFAIIGETLLSFLAWFYYGVLSIIKSVYPKPWEKCVKGDIVLITGGGSGIGRLMALKFARLGAVIVTVDVNETNNQETKNLIKDQGGECFAFKCDLSDREAIYQVAAKIKNEVGVVTTLVNNAGVVSGNALLDIPDQKIQQTFNVNILAHFWTVKAFLPDMIAQKKGHIVNIASVAGQGGTHLLTDYCASKFAAVGFDEALRCELDYLGHGSYIHCTAVCPYYINTGMFDGVTCKIIPILDPEYVADTIVQGVLLNTELVIIPPWIKSLLPLKSLMPVKAFAILGKATGMTESMLTFTGRKNK